MTAYYLTYTYCDFFNGKVHEKEEKLYLGYSKPLAILRGNAIAATMFENIEVAFIIDDKGQSIAMIDCCIE